MATINDILDWLNQGAQGDIPGTGGEQPNTGAASQPQMAGDVIAPEFRQGMPQNDQSQLNDQWPGGGPFNWGALPLGPHLVTPQQPTPRPAPQSPANEASAEGQKGAQAGRAAGTGIAHLLFGKQSQPTPQDYSGAIPPALMDHYQALVDGGLPPQMAHMILTQPSEFAGLFSEASDAGA